MKLTAEAKNILDKVNAGADINDESQWTDEENEFILDMTCSDGFGYGITDGGYIDLGKIIEGGEQLQKDINEVYEVWQKISVDI